MKLVIEKDGLSFNQVTDFVFQRQAYKKIEISAAVSEKIQKSHNHLLNLLEKNVPIYGVTTGFGDSCHRIITKEQSERLQKNLVSYLLCGTGPALPKPASRAMFLIRMNSLARGYSGVSLDLIAHMATLLEQDLLPSVPCEGSLGASGDLIPLAYLGEIIEGLGQIDTPNGIRPASEVYANLGLEGYKLKPKEGLALVNGTSAMAGLALVNLNDLNFLSQVSVVATSWLCLALNGKTEAFSTLVNEKAKSHLGQTKTAAWIRRLLDKEQYVGLASQKVAIVKGQTQGFIQDRYSLRCVPQILGPVFDTLDVSKNWLEAEISSTSDNPLIDHASDEMALGGNFYGGYLAHSMDYLKICIGNMADLLDRQLMTIIDDKSSRGLPPNLANWPGMSEDERHLHHGLKGLHQAVGAITSEVIAKAMPNSVLSRSSELHNQDKVSLGMSSAYSCFEMMEKLYTINALYLTCLAQALDLRGVKLKGRTTRALYDMIRDAIPFVEKDIALGEGINNLRNKLKKTAASHGQIIEDL